jgi:peptidoglycan/LPS O-acetylase OafA/YrhL
MGEPVPIEGDALGAAGGSGQVAGEDVLRRAFSVRRNLRALFVPPAGHLRPLDGLRALSILWVVLFHVAWYSAGRVPVDTYVRMLLSPWMVPVWRGDFGVDVFFVLSGFLIAGILIDERARLGRLHLGLFYARRLLRLWPALVVAVAADAAVIGDHVDMTWANVFYVSNFVPFAQVAMGWTWSLAIEEQFYLVCPWLVAALGDRRASVSIAIIGAIALGLCGLAALVVVAGGFHPFDSEIVLNREIGRWALGFDTLYTKPWMRAGPLLAGVTAAYVFRIPRAMEALATRRVAPVVAWVVALALGAAATHWQLVDSGPRALEVSYLATYRTVFGASVAYTILFALSRHPLGAALGRVLSVRVLFPFSQLAYSAYLFNPIVATVVHGALAPLARRHVAPPVALFLPLDFVGTFAVAAMIHLLVERPFMELRPRAAR